LRSLAHELVHHKQNCNGQFEEMGDAGEGYAQSNPHLRQMEIEANRDGSMCLRDWEDTYKKQLQESNYYSGGNKKMKLNEWKNAELASLIKEKFGIPEPKIEEAEEAGEKEADENTGFFGVEGDDDDDTYEGHIKADALEEEAVAEVEDEDEDEDEDETVTLQEAKVRKIVREGIKKFMTKNEEAKIRLTIREGINKYLKRKRNA